MRKLGLSVCIAVLAIAVPAGMVAAPALGVHRRQRVTLRLTSRFKHQMRFEHATATAGLRYTSGDVFVKLQTDGLPKLKSKVYVLFATDGNMTARVGEFRVHEMMAGVNGEVMMRKISDLKLYALSPGNTKRAQGTPILSAMVA